MVVEVNASPCRCLEDAGEGAPLVEVLLTVGGRLLHGVVVVVVVVVHPAAFIDPRVSSCPQDPREGLSFVDLLAIAS